MSLTLNEVFEKVGYEGIGYVFDAPIHYIVLNRKDNTWNQARINQYLEILDKIEATSGPGVMITIGTGTKIFSSGFDLHSWVPDFHRMHRDSRLFQEVIARLLEFSMPTMCIYNGKAMAGGVILGMAHDHRIMNVKGSICVSEIHLGLPVS